MAVRTLTFKNCVVRLEESGFTETLFSDGTRVPSYPTGEPEQAELSRRLGYGADVMRMCREHEILHTWPCELFWLPYSPDALGRGAQECRRVCDGLGAAGGGVAGAVVPGVPEQLAGRVEIPSEPAGSRDVSG